MQPRNRKANVNAFKLGKKSSHSGDFVPTLYLFMFPLQSRQTKLKILSFLAIILAENNSIIILDIGVFFRGFTLGHHSVLILWLAFVAKSTFSSEIATRLLARLTSSSNFWLKVDNWWQHWWTKSGQLRKYTQIHKL